MYLNILFRVPWLISPGIFNFLRYLQAWKQSICLIYSHLNPLIVLVVLKPFRQTISKVYILTFKSTDNGFGIVDPKGAAKHVSKTPNAKKRNMKNKTKSSFREYSTLVFFIIGLQMIILVLCWLAIKQSVSDLRDQQVALKETDERRLHKQQVLTSMQYLELDLSVSYTPRKFCAEKHGRINFHFMRCYVLTRHSREDQKTQF